MRPQVYAAFQEANGLMNSGDIHRAVEYLDSAYTRLEHKSPLEAWNRYYFHLTYNLRHMLDFEKASKYKDSMDIALKGLETVYKAEYSKNFFVEGDVLNVQKRYSEAFRSYFNGREFAKNHLSPCATADLTYQLGLFKYSQRDFEQAIPHVKQAVEEVSQCDGGPFNIRVSDRQMYLNTIALSYQKISMYDSAEHYYGEALAFIESKVPDYPQMEFPSEAQFLEVARGVVLGNLGGLLAEKGDYGRAIELLTESILVNDRPGYEIPDAVTAKIKLADVFLLQDRREEAYGLITEIGHSLTDFKARNARYFGILMRFHKLRWEYYDLSGNVEAAYKDLAAYMQLHESHEKAAAESRYLDMEESFRLAEQQYELSLVNRRNEMKNIYLIGFLAFSLIAAVFIINVLFNLKRYRLVNRQLRTQNNELEEAMGALEQSQAENSKMMHIVAHDLRNPISSMTMIAEVLLEGEGMDDESRMLLEHIKLSGNNSLNLVSEMLRVNPGESLKKESVDLERMLRYCVDLLQYRAEEKKQRITLEAKPVKAMVSREKMWRVISNLIANAIKFSDLNSVIRVKMAEQSGKVLISVEDQGIGIPDKLKDSIFDLFTDSKREGTAGEETYGMGLAISKQIVKAHHGDIWFKSTEGKGTTFYIELPLSE